MKNTILVLGGDGYFGWPLAMKVAVKHPDHKVIIIDNEWRRNMVSEQGFQTLLPIATPEQRLAAFTRVHGQENLYYIGMDVNSEKIEEVIATELPHTIFHLAQQCSASYSMKGIEEALFTISNNESGNMRLLWAVRRHVPDAHIIKLGSFGEYAQSGIEISEGYFTPQYKGKTASEPMPYPRAADDIYHVSKINDSNYVAMACRVWNLRITDVMQSTLFGFITDEMAGCEELYTRCDYDPVFGTVLNRFLVQAVSGHPLTVYGTGHQRTGLMALKDSVNSLAGLIGKAPEPGKHKVINHVTETKYSINELAEAVCSVAKEVGINVNILRAHNPRGEKHETKATYVIETDLRGHRDLHTPLADVAREMLLITAKFKDNISAEMFAPNVNWDAENTDSNSVAIPVNKAINGIAAKTTSNNNNTTSTINKNIVRHIVPSVKIKNDVYWEAFRKEHFSSDRINLNPGMLSTMPMVTRSAGSTKISKNMNGFPLGNYEQARNSHEEISTLCKELWPSVGYNVTVTHSTSQTMNLLALSILKKLNKTGKGPYKVVTTTHEHEGGIGCFQNMPEFDVHCISDAILADSKALGNVIRELKPEIALFSHVFYDTGNIAPVEEWGSTVRRNAPGCKIILDVAQSIGLHDIPFGCSDLVLGSTHKWLHGPQGGGLMWMNKNFQNWIEALYWSGNGLGYNPDTVKFSLPGGQDFKMYAAIERSLILYKHAGQQQVLDRASQLGGYLQAKLSNVFSAKGIHHVFLNNSKSSPVVTIAFTDYDPYHLYKYLNDQQVHVKCIKNHDVAGKTYHILRIGAPYYEHKDRLNIALDKIGKYLVTSTTRNIYAAILRQKMPVTKVSLPVKNYSSSLYSYSFDKSQFSQPKQEMRWYK